MHQIDGHAIWASEHQKTYGNQKWYYTSAWMEAAFLAWGGRYAAGFCAGGLADEGFVEVWEDFGPLAGTTKVSL